MSFEDDHGFVVNILMHFLLIMKVNEIHNFSNLFDKTLCFGQVPAHHREYPKTVYTQYVFVVLVLLAVC